MSTTELIARLPPDQLGGARVFRPTMLFGQVYQRNEVISAEVLRKVPRQNLRALIDQRFIVAWPVAASSVPVATDGEVFVFNRPGTSKFDVVVGQRLNAEPLSKADAEALAAQHRQPVAA